MRGVLTPREVEILDLMAEGFSNDEIAVCIDLAATTVKTHIKRIAIKMNVEGRSSSRTAAVALALRKGILK